MIKNAVCISQKIFEILIKSKFIFYINDKQTIRDMISTNKDLKILILIRY